MNPLPPHLMRSMERRAALCKILALGLIRLHMRDAGQVSEKEGEFPLHNSPDQSAHATTSKRRIA
jgi:hypothetical protein